MAEKGESPDEFGRRIAALYRGLSYPSEAKFRAALRKRGIKASAEFVKEVVADQSSRQLIAPPPRSAIRIPRSGWNAARAGNTIDV